MNYPKAIKAFHLVERRRPHGRGNGHIGAEDRITVTVYFVRQLMRSVRRGLGCDPAIAEAGPHYLFRRAGQALIIDA